ncbi:hypothetical protein TI39_contig369g00020 [Zymoseptoria brevis]|uniref:Uncharacterized protein n=1 Tax=Zymoseptoria brevis TaxID=1047168 RepID=A0A0F4GSJ9_9PEZI|nr:hypothetical protein TI39_contig369g00020 [Zymoseptoria brevis]
MQIKTVLATAFLLTQGFAVPLKAAGTIAAAEEQGPDNILWSRKGHEATNDGSPDSEVWLGKRDGPKEDRSGSEVWLGKRDEDRPDSEVWLGK